MLLGDGCFYFLLFWVGLNNRLIHIINLTYLTHFWFFFILFHPYGVESFFSLVPILSFWLRWGFELMGPCAGCVKCREIYLPFSFLFYFNSSIVSFKALWYIASCFSYVGHCYLDYGGLVVLYCLLQVPHTHSVNAFLLDSRQ